MEFSLEKVLEIFFYLWSLFPSFLDFLGMEIGEALANGLSQAYLWYQELFFGILEELLETIIQLLENILAIDIGITIPDIKLPDIPWHTLLKDWDIEVGQLLLGSSIFSIIITLIFGSIMKFVMDLVSFILGIVFDFVEAILGAIIPG